MRKVLRLSVLLLFGLVLSCQEDEGFSSIESNSRKDDSAQFLNNGFRVEQLNQEQIQQNQELQELLEQTNLIASENNSLYQSQSSSANSATFNLDLSHASYVSSADRSQEFYTFYVEDSAGDGFKNVVLSKQGEELQVLLLRYDVTEQEMMSYQTGEPIDFTGRTSVTMLDTNSIALQSQTSSGCTGGYWIEVTYYKEIPCDGDRSILGDYPCENWMPSTYQLVTELIFAEVECRSGGGITPNPGDNTTNPPSDWGSIFDFTGGGGGGNPSNDGSVNDSSTGEEQQTEPQEPSLEFGTSPVFPFRPIEEQIENCMAYYGNAPTTEQSQFLSTLAESGAVEFLTDLKAGICGGNQQDREKALRVIDLNIALEENPYLLLDIPCDQLPNWQEVAQHQVPQSGINKLSNLANGTAATTYDFNLQKIDDADGKTANLDYFSIVIDVLPNHPQTGVQFTASAFLEYIRKNMNTFVNTNISSFTPSTITGYNEASIWLSSNPINAIIHIDIPGNDGSVICSDHNLNFFSGYWRFSTIEVPWFVGAGWDGPHPVSGNRQFGYERNSNGSYTFYTRGVDRLENQMDLVVAESLLGVNPFHQADNLWTSFQNGIDTFVTQYDGIATPEVPKLYRPDWQKVRDYLNGNAPITSLGCQ